MRIEKRSNCFSENQEARPKKKQKVDKFPLPNELLQHIMSFGAGGLGNYSLVSRQFSLSAKRVQKETWPQLLQKCALGRVHERGFELFYKEFPLRLKAHCAYVKRTYPEMPVERALVEHQYARLQAHLDGPFPNDQTLLEEEINGRSPLKLLDIHEYLRREALLYRINDDLWIQNAVNASDFNAGDLSFNEDPEDEEYFIITEIPPELYSWDAEGEYTLCLGGADVSYLSPSAFSRLDGLTGLTLFGNSIAWFEAGTFSRLKSLSFDTLNLSDAYDETLFTGCSELQRLEFSYCSGVALTEALFAPLTSLTQLVLHECRDARTSPALFAWLEARGVEVVIEEDESDLDASLGLEE